MKSRKVSSFAQGHRAKEEVGLTLGLHSPLLHTTSIGHGLTRIFIGLLNNREGGVNSAHWTGNTQKISSFLPRITEMRSRAEGFK